MLHYEQDPPNAVQIELVEGCNLRCPFCGLNGIRGKENLFKSMSEDTIRQIGMALRTAMDFHRWNPRIEFAMHGEPTMHPHLYDMVFTLWECVGVSTPHIMMTSNGTGLIKGDITTNIDTLFNRGIQVLALDNYEHVKIVPKILAEYKGRVPVYNYPENPDASPHKRWKWDEEALVIVQDIRSATSGTHSIINNHAGAGAPKNENGVGKRCAKPFRELSFRWDGNVAICCNDWRGEYKIGSLSDFGNDINALWNADAFIAARHYLYHGQRVTGPCAGCDAISYRVGLLPDKYGKMELPLPDSECHIAADAALAGEPYTQPVKREWE